MTGSQAKQECLQALASCMSSCMASASASQAPVEEERLLAGRTSGSGLRGVTKWERALLGLPAGPWSAGGQWEGRGAVQGPG